MDKIYCRRRVKVPKLKGFYYNKKIKKLLSVILILSISISTFYLINKSVSPIFKELCIEKARATATIIINEESSNMLNSIDYEDIVYLMKDEQSSTNILKTDVVKINKIASNIALKVEKRLQELQNQVIEIPIGAFLNNQYLSGMGPNIKLSIIPAGNIITDLKTEFEDKGINQTTYRVYLELTCKINILTSNSVFKEEITNQVLLVETVIVGEVPSSYYNLENVGEDAAIELIE